MKLLIFIAHFMLSLPRGGIFDQDFFGAGFREPRHSLDSFESITETASNKTPFLEFTSFDRSFKL